MEVLLLSGGGSSDLTITASPLPPGEQLYKMETDHPVVMLLDQQLISNTGSAWATSVNCIYFCMFVYVVYSNKPSGQSKRS